MIQGGEGKSPTRALSSSSSTPSLASSACVQLCLTHHHDYPYTIHNTGITCSQTPAGASAASSTNATLKS